MSEPNIWIDKVIDVPIKQIIVPPKPMSGKQLSMQRNMHKPCSCGNPQRHVVDGIAIATTCRDCYRKANRIKNASAKENK